jgi:hypothetical protein
MKQNKATVEDFKRVIDIKAAEWLGTENDQYLRPQTLFGTKFEGYLNQKPGLFGVAQSPAADHVAALKEKR